MTIAGTWEVISGLAIGGKLDWGGCPPLEYPCFFVIIYLA